MDSSRRHRIVGSYADHQDAEDAAFRLTEAGFAVNDISIVARGFDSERWLRGADHDDSDPHDSTSAWTGGVLGMLVGAAFLWIPGAGPVAVTGGLASMLVGPTSPSADFARALGEVGLTPGERSSVGGYLVVAHVSTDEAAHAERVLAKASRTTTA